MTWPRRRLSLSPTIAFATSPTAGCSRNSAACSEFARSDSTSLRTVSSLMQFSSRKRGRSFGGHSRAPLYNSFAFCHRSGVIILSAQLTKQPNLCHAPVARDRRARDVQCFSGFLQRHSTKIPKFDNAGLLLIPFGKFIQSL